MNIEGFVIRKSGDLFSEELSDDCVQAAKKFNIIVKKVEGIYDNFDDLLKEEKLFINPASAKKFNTNGVKGCFLSHYTMWKKCLELNKPILIFEHDGLMINPLPENVLDKFNDYLNLDYSRHVFKRDMKNYAGSLKYNIESIDIVSLNPRCDFADNFKFMNKNHIVGAHGYILKPSGAEKIIQGMKKDGICPADIAPNLRYIEMYYTTETVVRVNEKMLENKGGSSHTR